MKKLTPMMKQYLEIKNKYDDSLLFFRLGDFYEMFFDDAKIASKELEITLTQRKSSGEEEGIPMCGVPHHVSDNYIARLVDRGYKVAICEQLEDPALAKGIVKRDVIKIVTPGTITDTQALDEKTNNYLLSIYMDELGVGLTYTDNSTGEMLTTQYIGDSIDSYRFVINEIGKIFPREIICNNMFSKNKQFMNIIRNKVNPYISIYPDLSEDDLVDNELILNQFKVNSIDNLNLTYKHYSTISTNKLIDYLLETQKNSLDHINNLTYYEAKDYMVMDINTRINLELNETIMNRSKKGSLLNVLDKTETSMGGRLLKKWLEEPLLDISLINKRHSMVEYFTRNLIVKDEINEILKGIYDIERLAGRISTGSCNGRDLISLKNSISRLPNLKEILISSDLENLKSIGVSLDDLKDLYILIEKSIIENPPVTITEGHLIKKGFNKDLDEIKEASVKGKEWLANLEIQERKKTGINNLKVGYNKVAGYFIEVTKANTSKVPDYFIRRQTLTNSERYHTEELKEMESKILGAEDKTLKLEYEIFVSIREELKDNIKRLQHTSKLISELDVILSFSKVALLNNYVKPEINNTGVIEIEDGRHPVVETMIEDSMFVPNDSYLDKNENMIQIITGPNMSGKSTYMRQVALITIMAQIGSFVPASKANIGVVDKIFTRIGASDNLSQGESTFMVEMNEVANIIREATSNSLLILDEVGRGTSTYDGLSLAWAIVEYIANEIKAKTLFATHYHELTQLEDDFKNIKNMTISAKEEGEDIVFLRKLIKGSTNKSYGIEVAKLAGINSKILSRANQILKSIESTHEINIDSDNNELVKENEQITFGNFKENILLDEISKIRIDSLTPIEALNTLNEVIQKVKDFKES